MISGYIGRSIELHENRVRRLHRPKSDFIASRRSVHTEAEGRTLGVMEGLVNA
jgi:hypothetical protein